MRATPSSGRTARTSAARGSRRKVAKRTAKRSVKHVTKTLAKRAAVQPASKTAATKPLAKVAAKILRPVKVVAAPPVPVLYKLCKPGWSVIVEQIQNSPGTRFVCPFCPRSHRVPGPVRGFKKMRRAQWSRLRRVEE
jgi:hypothetical protein